MRVIAILFAFLFITSQISYSQVGFGPELGVGFSNMKFIPPSTNILYSVTSSVSPVFSGKVGGLADIPLNGGHMFFQAGLSFSRKGAVRSFTYYLNDSFNESVHEILNLNYLELPLAVVYKSGKQGKGRFILSIGAAPSYLLGGQNKVRGHLVSAMVPQDTSFTSRVSAGQTFRGFDIGINLGAGYELPTGLFFRVYANMGVTDINPHTGFDKNRMYGIAAGYILGKGRNINKETDDLIDKSTDQ